MSIYLRASSYHEQISPHSLSLHKPIHLPIPAHKGLPNDLLPSSLLPLSQPLHLLPPHPLLSAVITISSHFYTLFTSRVDRLLPPPSPSLFPCHPHTPLGHPLATMYVVSMLGLCVIDSGFLGLRWDGQFCVVAVVYILWKVLLYLFLPFALSFSSFFPL